MPLLENGLTPIICVGESLEERENGTTNQVVDTQTVAALAGLTEASSTSCDCL